MGKMKQLGKYPLRFRTVTAHVPVFHPSAMLIHEEPCRTKLSQDSNLGCLQRCLEICTFVTPKTFWHKVKVGKHCFKPGTMKKSGHRYKDDQDLVPSQIFSSRNELCKQVFQCMINILSTLLREHRGRAVSKSESYLFWRMREFWGLIWSWGSPMLFAIFCLQITFRDLPFEKDTLFTNYRQIIEFETGLSWPMFLSCSVC